MKNEDKLDAQIAKVFDEVAVVRTGPDGKPATEFADACEEFRAAHKKFEKWDGHPDKYTDKWVRMEWWKALGRLSDTEKRVYRMFVGPEPTLKDNHQYNQFRQLYLEGKPTTANA